MVYNSSFFSYLYFYYFFICCHGFSGQRGRWKHFLWSRWLLKELLTALMLCFNWSCCTSAIQPGVCTRVWALNKRSCLLMRTVSSFGPLNSNRSECDSRAAWCVWFLESGARKNASVKYLRSDEDGVRGHPVVSKAFCFISMVSDVIRLLGSYSTRNTTLNPKHASPLHLMGNPPMFQKSCLFKQFRCKFRGVWCETLLSRKTY